MELTRTERSALNGIDSRWMILERERQLLIDEQAGVFRDVEARLGMASGAIGTTHEIANTTVREKEVAGGLPGPV